MNRRGFLRSILGGVAVAAFRPDLLLGPERVVIATGMPDAIVAKSLLEIGNAVTRKYFTPILVNHMLLLTPGNMWLLKPSGYAGISRDVKAIYG